MPRLAIVVSHPTQYYSPWFRWLSTNTSLRLRVFYLWDAGVRPTLDPQFGTAFQWDVDLLSGYEHEFVKNSAPRPGSARFGGLVNPSLPLRISAWRPDAILIFGYNYASHLGLIAWARLHAIPLIFRGDSHLLGRGALPWPKRAALTLLYRQFAAFAVVGAANREYFKTLGVSSNRLFAAPHCVDSHRFVPTDSALHAAEHLRNSLGLHDRRVVLFAGKLTSAKQPHALLNAFIQLEPADAALVFVGAGDQLAALEQLAASRPDLTVRFLPFANQSEMPSRYLLADIFVLPSQGAYETWGLAINEAMHLGVPCLVSDVIGCQRDLVTDGVTGWVFRSGDQAHLRQKLAEALAADLGAFRPRIAERINRYTYADAARGICAAVGSVLSSA